MKNDYRMPLTKRQVSMSERSLDQESGEFEEFMNAMREGELGDAVDLENTTLADLAEMYANSGLAEQGSDPLKDTFIIIYTSGNKQDAETGTGNGVDSPITGGPVTGGGLFTDEGTGSGGGQSPGSGTTQSLEKRVGRLEAAVTASQETKSMEERVRRLEQMIG